MVDAEEGLNGQPVSTVIRSMNELADIRRENLRAIIDREGLAVAARRFQKPDRQLNDMVAGRKSFGEKVARAMERHFDLVYTKQPASPKKKR